MLGTAKQRTGGLSLRRLLYRRFYDQPLLLTYLKACIIQLKFSFDGHHYLYVYRPDGTCIITKSYNTQEEKLGPLAYAFQCVEQLVVPSLVQGKLCHANTMDSKKIRDEIYARHPQGVNRRILDGYPMHKLSKPMVMPLDHQVETAKTVLDEAGLDLGAYKYTPLTEDVAQTAAAYATILNPSKPDKLTGHDFVLMLVNLFCNVVPYDENGNIIKVELGKLELKKLAADLVPGTSVGLFPTKQKVTGTKQSSQVEGLTLFSKIYSDCGLGLPGVMPFKAHLKSNVDTKSRCIECEAYPAYIGNKYFHKGTNRMLRNPYKGNYIGHAEKAGGQHVIMTTLYMATRHLHKKNWTDWLDDCEIRQAHASDKKHWEATTTVMTAMVCFAQHLARITVNGENLNERDQNLYAGLAADYTNGYVSDGSGMAYSKVGAVLSGVLNTTPFNLLRHQLMKFRFVNLHENQWDYDLSLIWYAALLGDDYWTIAGKYSVMYDTWVDEMFGTKTITAITPVFAVYDNKGVSTNNASEFLRRNFIREGDTIYGARDVVRVLAKLRKGRPDNVGTALAAAVSALYDIGVNPAAYSIVARYAEKLLDIIKRSPDMRPQYEQSYRKASDQLIRKNGFDDDKLVMPRNIPAFDTIKAFCTPTKQRVAAVVNDYGYDRVSNATYAVRLNFA